MPEYQQTAAIWGRGVLQHEFGVHPREIEWHMERTPETSHGGSTGFKPPEGVTVNRIPISTNIGEMMVKGELDATLLYLTHANLVDRSRIDLSKTTASGCCSTARSRARAITRRPASTRSTTAW